MHDPSAAAAAADPASVTGVLLRCAGGEEDAVRAVFPLVYHELRRLAHRQLASEADGHTLSTTAVVHEAYLRLEGQHGARWKNRGQFMAVAATAMRRVLVDHARRRSAGKRGGGAAPLPLDAVEFALEPRGEALLALDAALEALEAVDPRLVRVVELRFFAGLTEEETAALLGVSDRTVRRDWTKARGWLYREIRERLT